MRRPFHMALLVSAIAGCAAPTAEERAVAYLGQELPRWLPENGCRSCHHHGDAARALFVARRRGLAIPRKAIAEPLAWLERPSRWDENRGDPAASDKKLARLQFAAALASARASGLSSEASALSDAARFLVMDQDSDGAWRMDSSTGIGGPTAYGERLATAMAFHSLRAADSAAQSGPIERAKAVRSEERRVGKECPSLCRSRWSPYH